MSNRENDSLGNRMKSYEDSYRISLPNRMPVILRIDGKAFHTYTRQCKKPVDRGLVDCMNTTAKELCERIQGTKLAYVQSDEISLLLTNYDTLDTQSWFDNNLQKMVSISAGIASSTFTFNSWRIWMGGAMAPVGLESIKPAVFDSRAFLVPREDVCNYFLWRQQDATRNSVQMLARSMYSHKECENKDNSELQEMIFRKGVNWNDSPTSQKRGRCLVKQTTAHDGFNPRTGETVPGFRTAWVVDNEIPIFSQDREYVNRFVNPDQK
jgi:tRNA(His) guanylyltransferase